MNETLLPRVKTLYGADIPYSDNEILEFLQLAKEEIIRWLYNLVEVPDDVDVSNYATVQIMAVIYALTQHGAEGESAQTEGSFRREFSYPSMLEYIHRHVIPYAGVGR